MVYRELGNKNFSQRAQQGIVVAIGEEIKGYVVYLPKDKNVVTSQHMREIETLNKAHNLQVQRLYQDEDAAEDEEEAEEQGCGTAGQSATSKKNGAKGRGKGRRKKSIKKKAWTRVSHVTRSVTRGGAVSAEAAQQDTHAVNFVNSVLERDPIHYKEAMHSQHKVGWMEAMVKELKVLEDKSVWEVVRLPKIVHVLHTNVTVAVVIDMSSVKRILALTRKWHVPAKHGDVPNAYVKSDKGENLRIYIRVSQGMEIPEEILKGLGVETDAEVVPELKKALYGLKQAGRHWSKLLHSKHVEIDFHQSLVDICVYYRSTLWRFFEELKSLEIKDLGCAHKFLEIRINYSDNYGYDLD
ncbi:mitochondrial protein [Phytophthora palmivora]|uniref:Mitochondrial protein n=1 Tax=Phytophthora palmivora TaxID=4796 RepID=A0A2P4WVL9_9STRA|nr:mitochondrial protein [Phytophthora palmivora]